MKECDKWTILSVSDVVKSTKIFKSIQKKMLTVVWNFSNEIPLNCLPFITQTECYPKDSPPKYTDSGKE